MTFRLETERLALREMSQDDLARARDARERTTTFNGLDRLVFAIDRQQ